jgi:hypothetical protein
MLLTVHPIALGGYCESEIRLLLLLLLDQKLLLLLEFVYGYAALSKVFLDLHKSFIKDIQALFDREFTLLHVIVFSKELLHLLVACQG